MLVNKPEDWEYSSYDEYINKWNGQKICKYDDLIEIKPEEYIKFVNNQISYQRELAKIKKLLID